MTRIVKGLTKHYGFDRESEDIRYWTLHMGVDEEHMKVGRSPSSDHSSQRFSAGPGVLVRDKNPGSILARFRLHQARLCRQRSAVRALAQR
jgi:hypothetical protein